MIAIETSIITHSYSVQVINKNFTNGAGFNSVLSPGIPISRDSVCVNCFGFPSFSESVLWLLRCFIHCCDLFPSMNLSESDKVTLKLIC